jgi:hypothetical protein
MPLHHSLGAVTEPQIDKRDDPGNAACRSINARAAHGRGAANELGLASGASARHIERVCSNIVARMLWPTDIRQQLWHQIAITGAVPKMMVRIDNRQIRFEDRLGMLGQPIRSDRRLRHNHERRAGWHRLHNRLLHRRLRQGRGRCDGGAANQPSASTQHCAA